MEILRPQSTPRVGRRVVGRRVAALEPEGNQTTRRLLARAGSRRTGWVGRFLKVHAFSPLFHLPLRTLTREFFHPRAMAFV